MPTPKRSDATAGIKQEEGESKKRIRKIEDTGRRGSQRSGEDVLDDRVLTKRVWDEVYDIFKLHFSTEMPFLHPQTFRSRMRQAWFPRDPTAQPAEHQDGNVLLLGVLTLTARFQPDLMERHSQGNDPTAASEYYAQALAAAFGPTSRNLTHPSLEGIQALLMLGLYEWGQTRGLSAWVYVGIATRLAQSMGFPFVDDEGNPVLKPAISSDSLRGHAIKQALSPRDELLEKEVRRRTWWSCFIMDRMLSAGKCRPTMIDVEKYRVRLPCSEDQFLFVSTIKMDFLRSNWLSKDRPADNSNDDNILSWYLRLVEIFGRFSEWSYAGGRRTETEPPWETTTKFYQYRQEFESFNAALPSNLTFTDANLSAHIEKRNATAYASMHTLYMLSLIMLHREYIPFIPLRTKKPSGPLDDPKFPEDKYDIPPRFWQDSAKIMFTAARDIIRIVKTCQEDSAMPESPQIGFAIWQAAFVCIYGYYFPHMDEGQIVQGGDYIGMTRNMLDALVPRLRMVKAYKSTVTAMHKYFDGVKWEWNEYIQKGKPLRWTGGAGDKYLSWTKPLKEFGNLSDTERHVPSEGSDADQSGSRASTNEIGQAPSVNGEAMQGVEAVPTSRSNGAGAWAAINTGNATSPPPDDRPRFSPQGPHPYGAPASGQYQPGHHYQQSPNQSNMPSLASPSNGDSSGLNSPYVVTQSQYNPANHPPHGGQYAAMVQQGQPVMPPPSSHTDMAAYGDLDSDKVLQNWEGIRWTTGFDNFSQEEQHFNLPGRDYANPAANMDFLQVVHLQNASPTYMA